MKNLKGLFAVFAVMAMVGVAFTGGSFVSDDSAAVADYQQYSESYYYDQLNPNEQAVYNALLSANLGLEFNVTLRNIVTAGGELDEEKIVDQVSRAYFAYDLENRKAEWTKLAPVGSGGNIQCGSVADLDSDGQYDDIQITLKLGMKEYFVSGAYSGTPAEINQAINDAIDAISVDKSSSYAIIKSIDSYLTSTITYNALVKNNTSNSQQVRTITGSLVDSKHYSVCEGYARSFKAVCDRNGIEAILVTGEGKDSVSATPEGHMYNYVCLPVSEGVKKWFLVDSTWNDPVNASPNTDFLLVGNNTVISNLKVSESHIPGTMFHTPTLADDAYVPVYEVTFHNDGVEEKLYTPSVLGEPTAPVKEGYTFAGWFTDDAFTVKWNFNIDKVTKDMNLYARWIDNGENICKITYVTEKENVEMKLDTSKLFTKDATVIPDAYLISGETAPTYTDPVKMGYSFDGWYTDSEFKNKWDPSVAVTKDMTVYAKWTASSPGTKAIAFLSSTAAMIFGEENIVDGVDNWVILFAVIVLTLVVIILILNSIRKHKKKKRAEMASKRKFK